MEILNQAAKRYFNSERREDNFNRLYNIFTQKYTEKYYEKIAENENLDKHDVQAVHEDALLKTLEYDCNNFINLLRKIIKNNLNELKRKRISREYVTDFENISSKYLIYYEKGLTAAEGSRQLLRDLVRSANFGPKENETLRILNEISTGIPIYQAAEKTGVCPKTVRRRLRKIADQYSEEKYGFLVDYVI